MGIEVQRVERMVQIIVAKPLAWALYGCGKVVVGLARASFRWLRSLLHTQSPAANRDERRERAWQRPS